MKYEKVFVERLGHILPPTVLTSTEIEEKLDPVYKRLKLPEGRLEMMSGVKERRLWKNGTLPSQAGIMAGQKALEASGVDPELIGCLLHCSISKDCLEPATASMIHAGLPLPAEAMVFDLSNACLGFANGMLCLANMIELGQVKAGLIVAAECAEDLYQGTFHTLLNDPNISRKGIKYHFASMTTGSGAVAVVMTHSSIHNSNLRLLSGTVRNATQHHRLCTGDHTEDSKLITMFTDSEKLLEQGCALAGVTWKAFKKELGWDNNQINRVFTHQVGVAHQKLLFETIGLSQQLDHPTLEFLGNVGSVSMPISMALGLEKNPPNGSGKIALLGIGSGLNCCMLGLEWD